MSCTALQVIVPTLLKAVNDPRITAAATLVTNNSGYVYELCVDHFAYRIAWHLHNMEKSKNNV
jgi:hypothetical protein